MARRVNVSHGLPRPSKRLPLADEGVDASFETVRATGVLPTQHRLALAVVVHALPRRRPDYANQPNLSAGIRELHRLAKKYWAGESLADETRPDPDNPRRTLLAEALCDDELIRPSARLAPGLAGSVRVRHHPAAGPPLDLEALYGPRETGTWGMHVLGLPETAVAPEHAEQFRRLVRRMTLLPARAERRGAGFIAQRSEAFVALMATGELPDERLLRACVLAEGEAAALIGQHCLKPYPELIAAWSAGKPTRSRPRPCSRGAGLPALWRQTGRKRQ